MKVETAKLKGRALDWAVAKIEGALAPVGNVKLIGTQLFITVGSELESYAYGDGYSQVPYNPSADWAQGGVLADQYDISVWLTFGNLAEKGKWSACMPNWFDLLDPTAPLQPEAAYGDTQLEAGMRALVRDKLGDEVEVPDELAE